MKIEDLTKSIIDLISNAEEVEEFAISAATDEDGTISAVDFTIGKYKARKQADTTSTGNPNKIIHVLDNSTDCIAETGKINVPKEYRAELDITKGTPITCVEGVTYKTNKSSSQRYDASKTSSHTMNTLDICGTSEESNPAVITTEESNPAVITTVGDIISDIGFATASAASVCTASSDSSIECELWATKSKSSGSVR